jgi:hypothetical protein
MSKSNVTELEEENELGSIVQQFIYRLPKKNHEAMVQLERQFIEIFRKHVAKCGNDENMNQLYKQFMNLITPGSAIMGEFSRVRV